MLVRQTEHERKLKKSKYNKEYWKKNKTRASEKHKEWIQKNEEKVKEYGKEYYQRPEVKIRRKEYMERPEVKEHKEEYMREYNKLPEVKTRKNKLERKRRLKNKPEHQSVYIISHPNYPGMYKVGISFDPKDRLHNANCWDPDRRYKLEFSMEHPEAEKIEKQIHKGFTFSFNSEWVKSDLQILKECIIS